MAMLLNSLDPEMYDANNYVIKVWDSIGEELTHRSAAQAQLDAQRKMSSEEAQLQAELQNTNYVQQLYASWTDLITTNSTVPAVVDQADGAVQNDNVLEKTLPQVLSGNMVIDGRKYSTNDVIERALLQLAMACDIASSDPDFIAQQLKIDLPAIREGNVKAYQEFMGKLETTISSDASRIDCSKEVAAALVQRAGADFAKDFWSMLKEGKMTPNNLMKTFDRNMANLSTQFGKYIGAALGGIPSPISCASMANTDNSLLYAETAMLMESGLGWVAGCGEFGAKLMNQANNIYRNGDRILLNMAETMVQDTVGMAFMAIHTASKTNCAINLMRDFATGCFIYGEATIKGGIKILNSVQKMDTALSGLMKTVERKDILGDLKKRAKLHPCVRTVNTLVDSTNVDIRTYLKITQTGVKFARIALGADRQHKISSMALHSEPYIRDAWSVGYIKRYNWSTDLTCNRYNEYGVSRYNFRYN